jgi:hypothetical protein
MSQYVNLRREGAEKVPADVGSMLVHPSGERSKTIAYRS